MVCVVCVVLVCGVMIVLCAGMVRVWRECVWNGLSVWCDDLVL